MRRGRRTMRRIVVVTTDRHDFCLPILVQFLLLLSLLPSTVGMTDRHRHNGPSRVSVPKYLNSWNLGTGLLLCLREEPAGRTVILSVTPHLVRLPHLPSASALRCHLRTITSMTDHHKLRRWSLLHFFAQNFRIYLWTDLCISY